MNSRKQTPDQATTLRDYIREVNESAGGGFTLSESMDHWARHGIFTFEQLRDHLTDCAHPDHYADEDECEEPLLETPFEKPKFRLTFG